MEPVECLNKCEFQEFGDGEFFCEYYDKALHSRRDAIGKVIVNRCSECIAEGVIGTNTVEEKVLKLKRHIGWLMDFFYSFKDDMEAEVSDIYRILKELEDETTDIQED